MAYWFELKDRISQVATVWNVLHGYGSAKTFASHIRKLRVVFRNEFDSFQYAFDDRVFRGITKSSFNFMPDTAPNMIYIEREEGHEKVYQMMGQ